VTEPRRDKTRQRRFREAHRSAGAACSSCGLPIDYGLPGDDPMSFWVDHTVPLDHGGPDVLENTTAMHRKCNQSKGAKPDESEIRRCSSLIWP
jgi:5-methylcytosine-specific restriction endonuclease McrA